MHRIILWTLILAGFSVAAYIIFFGVPYYTAELTLRPRMELHDVLRPSGRYGHGYGIAGSAMLLLLFLYSVRKRVRWFPKIGRLSTWLKYHMFLGVMGPVLVTFHTTFKFGGIVSVSYWSMVIVMLSGFVGRYLYSRIPRTISGHEMNLQQVQEENRHLAEQLRTEFDVPASIFNKIAEIGSVRQTGDSEFRTILRGFWADLKRPFELRSIFAELKEVGDIGSQKRKSLRKLARRRAALNRNLSILEVTHRFFHHWHVFHKPFAYVMILIMFIHIGVVLLFGYQWIF
ncbi:MAG: hypothetical protein K9N46_06595 [Candidatus Marinimicrobia bacterium]|nr:hypothetical protein [Candidatus Neomarinimicrobiota bacterium]MCF7828648.1 hypothetical protein [Candidatus Neomarinimicrobiota bacterium]MCF7880389.1 hypothetical protein [Candidatus Neomarinimicrobiota bacterium]